MGNKAQVIHKLGSPRAMKWEDWPIPNPGPGEVRLKHTAIGVNFADTYHRGGISHPGLSQILQWLLDLRVLE